MDSLTVHYVARELDQRWRGHRVLGCLLDPSERTVIAHIRGSDPVRFRLASREVRVERCAWPADAKSTLLGDWIVAAVESPIDDRRLIVRLERPGKFKGSLTKHATLDVSVYPPARGAVLREGDTHRLAAVGSRVLPSRSPRPLLSEEQLRRAVESGDDAALLEGRWVSPPVARWLLRQSDAIVERYAWLCSLPDVQASRCGSITLPLPLCDDPEPASSLIADGAAEPVATPARTRLPPRARALQRLRAELERAKEAPRLRVMADALAALGERPAPESIQLPHHGECAVSRVDGDRAIDVAERLYGEVRSMERALANLPNRIAEMERRADAPPFPRPARPARTGRSARAVQPRTPYRTYRTSGGLAVWGGRGAASNEELTFTHSAPDDVWLHARGAAGAHVVLRWQEPENPPARDLEEAAALAAWHSKARGSSVVPVDWTRRREVRRARGAKAGTVLLNHSRTIFARPSGELERRLRAAPDED